MIDLRQEFSDILVNQEGAGRWIVVRHFLETKSAYYNEVTKEGIGGPDREYTDVLTESYSMPAIIAISPRAEGFHQEHQMLYEETIDIFYMFHDIVIEEGDEIFDLDYYEATRPIIVVTSDEAGGNKVTMKMRYKVRKVEKYRFDGGRIEYLKVIADKHIFR